MPILASGEMQDAELERWKRDQVQQAEERLHKARGEGTQQWANKAGDGWHTI